MMSGVSCTSCNQGYVFPSDPMDFESQWKCNNDCGYAQSAASIEECVNELDSLINATADEEIETFENILDDITKRLHPNHNLVRSKCDRVIKRFCNPYTVKSLLVAAATILFGTLLMRLLFEGGYYFKHSQKIT